MRVFAGLAVFVGAVMFANPNTAGDMVAGAVIAFVGLIGLFAPMRRQS